MNVNLIVENVTQMKSGIIMNVGTSVEIHKTITYVKKVIFGILLHVLAKNGNHLGSNIEDSMIKVDEIINTRKTFSIKINEKW